MGDPPIRPETSARLTQISVAATQICLTDIWILKEQNTSLKSAVTIDTDLALQSEDIGRDLRIKLQISFFIENSPQKWRQNQELFQIIFHSLIEGHRY